MKKHRLLVIATAALVGLTLIGCGKKSNAASSKTVKIGILQLIDQSALTEARRATVAIMSRSIT